MPQPIYKSVRRTWRERFLTWPWNPFRATRRERDFDAEAAVIIHTAERTQQPAHIRSPLRRGHVPPRPIPAPAPRMPAKARDAEDSGWPVTSPFSNFESPRTPSAPDVEPYRSGGGGEFAGGGASGSWDSGSSSDSSSSSSSSDSSSSSSDSGSSPSSSD